MVSLVTSSRSGKSRTSAKALASRVCLTGTCVHACAAAVARAASSSLGWYCSLAMVPRVCLSLIDACWQALVCLYDQLVVGEHGLRLIAAPQPAQTHGHCGGRPSFSRKIIAPAHRASLPLALYSPSASHSPRFCHGDIALKCAAVIANQRVVMP